MHMLIKFYFISSHTKLKNKKKKTKNYYFTYRTLEKERKENRECGGIEPKPIC